MTANIHEPSDAGSIAANRFGLKEQKQRPLAFRWWEPGCSVGTDGCTGEEPSLVNGWAQPGDPLQKFAFRLHADGSLEFRGHLDSAGASSDTVAVTLPGANAGEVDFLTGLPKDQFFLTVIWDGATAQPAMVYIDHATGDVTITFPV